MDDHLFKWSLLGFFCTAAAGTLLHFTYAWSGRAPWLAPFCPINESVWEHLKMLYWPLLFFTVLEFFRKHRAPAFLWARACGLIIGLLLTVIFYYTYTGVIGRGFLAVDIALFFFSVLTAFGMSYILLTRYPAPTLPENILWAAAALLVGLALLCYTWAPPRIHLFQDPKDGTYGVVADGGSK